MTRTEVVAFGPFEARRCIVADFEATDWEESNAHEDACASSERPWNWRDEEEE